MFIDNDNNINKKYIALKNEFIKKFCLNQYNNKVRFNRLSIKPEFTHLINGLKSKEFKDFEIEMIFINDNIYRQYATRFS